LTDEEIIQEVTRLKNEFDETYKKALKLQENPDNPEYIQIKEQLDVNLTAREKLLRG
jgi:hypothetical protein